MERHNFRKHQNHTTLYVNRMPSLQFLYLERNFFIFESHKPSCTVLQLNVSLTPDCGWNSYLIKGNVPLIKVILVIDISTDTFIYRILIIFVDIYNDISGISISSAWSNNLEWRKTLNLSEHLFLIRTLYACPPVREYPCNQDLL